MEIIQKYLQVIIKYRRTICYNVVIFTVLATIISFILPNKYKATAQILPPTEEPDLLGFTSMITTGMASSGLSRLARAGGLFRSTTSSDLIGAILQSRTIGEQVVTECNIMKEYRIKKGIEKALKLLKSITGINVTNEGIVQISIQAKKPALAADIANSYVNLIDKFLKESNMSRGKSMRIFIEKRLGTAEQDLKDASDSLKSFLERNKVVALDEETKSVIDAYAQLKSELLKREIELGVSEDISTPDNPYVASIKREIDEFKRQLQEMESGKKAGTGFGVGFAISFQKLPAVAQEYTRRYRDYKAQEEIYALLLQQFEQAKILEARDTPTITILDYARVPEKKSFPKRSIIIITVAIISAIFGVIYAVISEYVDFIKKEKFEEYTNWQKIIKSIKIDLVTFRSKVFPRSKK